MCISKVAED